MGPEVLAFFDKPTNTVSYVVKDPQSNACAIVDAVLDFDPVSGRTAAVSTQAVAAFVEGQGLRVDWILETHAHADHLSAAPNLKDRLGAKIGTLRGCAIHTPGHTPDCMTYIFGDAAFIGDTLFMPDYGTARCDFPGGDARQLDRSIQKIFALPPRTRLFLCHDYLPPSRAEYRWEATVAKEKAHSIQINDGVTEDEFVEICKRRAPHPACLGSSSLLCKSTCGPGNCRLQKTVASLISRYQ
jgi:glyoxylase-like metal-dependent hydrolase (beta-lactamase superfamily II)